MKPAGKPDAGNPHVRFDERGWETGRCSPSVPAPTLDSTDAARRSVRHKAMTLRAPGTDGWIRSFSRRRLAHLLGESVESGVQRLHVCEDSGE